MCHIDSLRPPLAEATKEYVPRSNRLPAYFSLARNFDALRAIADDSGCFFAAVTPSGSVEIARILVPRGDDGGVWCVGRHAAVDLQLTCDASVPLRACAIHVAGDGRSVRVFDLRTRDGLFIHGLGRTSSVIINGPVAVEVGAYLLLIVPRDCGFWSNGIASAWSQLARPETSANDCKHWGPAVGFEIAWDGRCLLATIASQQLAGGVLLGRYDRCELGGPFLRRAHHLSRVHALFFVHNDATHVFDLGTMSGTTLNSHTRRFCRVSAGDKLVAADVHIRVRGSGHEAR